MICAFILKNANKKEKALERTIAFITIKMKKENIKSYLEEALEQMRNGKFIQAFERIKFVISCL